MRRLLPVLAVLLTAGTARANGLLIPDDKHLPPLALVNHRVTISLDDQVGVTTVEQTFRNHTDRELEATYIFPVPRGASVNQFSMHLGTREVKGELVEADKARKIYTDLVRRTQDPALLEYLGNNLLRLRVYPVPPKGDQKVTLRFTALALKDQGVVEYVYPLRNDSKATQTLEDFSITATIKSQQPIQNVYSPTHYIHVTRITDREATVKFEKNQAVLDKDFQLFYATGDKDVGVTTLVHRPAAGDKGYFLMLLSPRVELSPGYQIPRDVVLVLDTSGSMQGAKIDQARRALRYVLDNLGPQDRFGVIHFATTVNRYRDGLTEASPEQLGLARRWVDGLSATGGTNINDALQAALEMRPGDTGRPFTIVFFTDGMPTVGVTQPEQIFANVKARNTAETRIFTFGVGDDVNATLLDRLADETRAVSTYVRPAEDIEAKVSSLYGKISQPVLANLKLTASEGIRLEEMYPPRLPDLFHGGQVVVLGRYDGKGHVALTVTGSVGQEERRFVYEVHFPEKTGTERDFVEQLWARRKVGYLLDQIRAHGEKKELVDEITALAKKYGIATPYTSYLIVPDAPMPIAAGVAGRRPGTGDRSGAPGAGLVPFGLAAPGGAAEPLKVADFARFNAAKGSLGAGRSRIEQQRLNQALPPDRADAAGDGVLKAQREAQVRLFAFEQARAALGRRHLDAVQGGQLGVELSVAGNYLRSQSNLTQTAVRCIANRNCLEIGGVWIDEAFDPKMPVCTVKAQSPAYFRLLEKQPQLKDLFKLGNHLLWVTPSGTALVIDTRDGTDQLSDAEIDQLFVASK